MNWVLKGIYHQLKYYMNWVVKGIYHQLKYYMNWVLKGTYHQLKYYMNWVLNGIYHQLKYYMNWDLNCKYHWQSQYRNHYQENHMLSGSIHEIILLFGMDLLFSALFFLHIHRDGLSLSLSITLSCHLNSM